MLAARQTLVARKLEEEAGETKENKVAKKEKKEVLPFCTSPYYGIVILGLGLVHEYVLLSEDSTYVSRHYICSVGFKKLRDPVHMVKFFRLLLVSYQFLLDISTSLLVHESGLLKSQGETSNGLLVKPRQNSCWIILLHAVKCC